MDGGNSTETQLKLDLVYNNKMLKQECEQIRIDREQLNREREELRRCKIELLQNNILIKKQYEILRSKYKSHVESLVITKITEEIRTADEIETNKLYLQQLAQTSVTKDNEEEFQNVYGMVSGLTVIIGCNFNYPIEAPRVKISSDYKLFHPNVGENGVMKFSLIDHNWCIGITLTKLVEVVKEILATPDLNAIANKEAALLYIDNKDEYYKRSVMNIIEINSPKK